MFKRNKLLIQLTILIILHLALLNPIVFAEEVDNADQTIDDENWIDYGTHTLNWGDIIEVGGYYFEATDFSVGSASEIKPGEEVWALLTIYKDETPIWRNVFSAGHRSVEEYIYTSEPDKELYTFTMNKTATYDDKIKVLCTEIVISSNIKSPYMKIQIYIKKILKPITVKEWINKTIKITKTIRKIAYMGERSIVHIKITNLSKVNPDKILVTDYLPVDLIVDPDQDLLWNITDSDIDDIKYSIRALKPGNYELPPAKVQLEYYGQNYIFYSNKPTIKVDGPYVIITKTASKKNISPSDTVDIKVTVKNIGNKATYVYVTDQLPANTKLVSGVLNFTTVLQPSGTNNTTTNNASTNTKYIKSDSTIYTNTYTIKCDSDVTLPAAVAQYMVPKQIDKYIVYRPSAPQSTEKYINPKFYSDIAKSSIIQISMQTPIEPNQTETPQNTTENQENTSNVDQTQTQSQISIENQTQSETKGGINETKNNKKFSIHGFEMFYALIVLLVLIGLRGKGDKG